MHCYLGKRKDSPKWYIYEYDQRTGQCKRYPTRTTDRSAAEKKLAEHIIKLPQRHQVGDATLVEIMLRYWEHHGQKVFATNAIRRVIGLVAKHEPHTRLCDWTIPLQKEFAAKIGRTPSTQRRYMGIVRTAVKRSYEHGEIPTLPAIWRIQAEDGAGVVPFEVDELRRLMDAATLDHERRLLLLLIATAARPNAVLGITWDRIREGVVDLNEPGRRRTKKRRAMAPLACTAIAYLEAHRSVGPVVQWNGKAMTGHKMTFARIAGRAKVTGSAYGIRKAVAIWLRKEGVPEWDIKGLLGHSTGGVTDRYAHYRPEYMRAAAASVERLLREICPSWLASYLPLPSEHKSQVAVSMVENGGSYPIRTDDQFLKRDGIELLFQELKASNDD